MRTEQETSIDKSDIYFKEIGLYPLLKPDEEKSLGGQISTGRDLDKKIKMLRKRIGRTPTLDETAAELNLTTDLILETRQNAQEAVNRLIEANLAFVVKIARSLQGRGLEISDLIQAGNLGLDKAARNFDPEKGRFTTYAEKSIRRQIHREIARLGRSYRLPPQLYDLIPKVRAAEHELVQTLEKEPSAEEIAAKMGIKTKHISYIISWLKGRVSLERNVPTEDGWVYNCSLDGFVPSANDQPVEIAENKDRTSQLQRALGTLKPREKTVILAYYAGGKTFKQVGAEMGVSDKRARALKEQALGRLRQPATTRRIQDYWE